VLDTATRLFTAHGVHAVGMDRLIAESGLGKMSVYRLYPTKDDLVGAYLSRLADEIFDLVDADLAGSAGAAAALHAILSAIEGDLARPGFRGCPFGNAAGEYDDPTHPARRVARDYREGLLGRLELGARRLDATGGPLLARRLAVLIDGAYLSAAHLGPTGPAADGLALAHTLVDAATRAGRGDAMT
jgi:AcrR family transcriptional regulator